jgi:hypothetical protein
MFSLEPTIDRKGIPSFVSWLDLLSQDDLAFKGDAPYDREGTLPYLIENNYFMTYFSRDKIPHLIEARQVYRKPIKEHLRQGNTFSLVLNKEQIPFIDLLDVEYTQLKYRIAITPQGRIRFITPLILPLNSSATLYLDEYLREYLLFLGRERLSWTNIEVVIK